MDNIFKLHELIEKALIFFESPETETLNLDELEVVLRDVLMFLNKQTTAEINTTISDGDQYREYIVRQVEGWMRALNYPENEISLLVAISSPEEIMKTEERVRREFDRQFHVKPIVPDKISSEVRKVQVYKIN